MAKQRLVAVTACPTGIAHTYMAAEALSRAAEAAGVEIKVETEGSVGAENRLTEADVAAAQAVIIAADTGVDEARFAGKPIIRAGTGDAIHGAEKLIQEALRRAAAPASSGDARRTAEGLDYLRQVEAGKEERRRSLAQTGAYRHLLTGVSYMIPFVVAGGILIAISFAFGIHAADVKGSLPAALMQIGGQAAFALMVPILAGYIAYSIADRPGLAPGMIGGILAAQTGAGFLGGIVAGFLAGYLAAWLVRAIRLPKGLEGLKPILIVPLLSSLVVGLAMIYVVGVPVRAAMDGLTHWLRTLSTGSAVVLGLVMGAMMAFDMGGPVNKAAYTFGVALLGSGVYEPMAAVMAAGMTPPLGLALATQLFPRRFTPQEKEAGRAAWVLGISFITEGAIPFAAADPFRVIPSLMAGSALTGALSMLFHVQLRAPHGGIFVLPIPNVVTHLGLYALSIVIGTVVTALIVGLVKRPVEAAGTAEEAAPARVI
ncbi:MAG: fructose-specific PTS transporter subunit EIIC [Bacillota bacterium]|nr:fructose-specific PTS transporter subunit EIIC [Bacillota bacterium]